MKTRNKNSVAAMVRQCEAAEKAALEKMEREYKRRRENMELAYEVQKETAREGMFYFPLDINVILRDVETFRGIGWDIPSVYAILIKKYRAAGHRQPDTEDK